MTDPKEARARSRRADPSRWPVRRYKLGEEPGIDPLDHRSVSERIAAMWPLAVRMWTLSGGSLPDYERSEAPGVVRRARSNVR